MKKIIVPIIIFILCFFTFCKNNAENNNSILNERRVNSSDTISTESSGIPMGDEMLVKISFPRQWDNLTELDDTNSNFNLHKTSKNGYDSLFYFIEKNNDQLYNGFQTNNKIKLTVPLKYSQQLLSLYDNNVVLDKMYWVKTIKNSSSYSVELYKNGNKYQSFLGSEREKVSFNYLSLVTHDKNKKPIDYLLIYYNNHDDILGYKRFFYIDEDLKITMKDFVSDELTTKYLKENIFKISNEGYFTK
ncbi:hypothetical protein [Bergeyella zoohelcum]|uniref:Uncharacterized protein n=1 Tax=Bergeyella zoohelcum TaxID=1015 RepID=A0A380ZVA3_9FLAO|nr:hypothetical protein [Bergeyella zoohelcum]EKB58788.1 hypothetical protein HMPREF9700_01738 [Bergeyella zoohelcum CCUG 30536]SUV53257.1 Uncharacterised protein [Bergeyella zoohelcum]